MCVVNTIERDYTPDFLTHGRNKARCAIGMDNRTANYPLSPNIFPFLQVTDVKALFITLRKVPIFFSKFHSYLLQTFSNQVPQLFETISAFALGTPVTNVSTESLKERKIWLTNSRTLVYVSMNYDLVCDVRKSMLLGLYIRT
jgi:hypothetical protein